MYTCIVIVLAVSWYICDLLLLLICIYKWSCWSSHLLHHLLALTVDVTYYHIRCCGVIWSAFTFSEELGFEEGGHGGFLSPCICNLSTSGQLVHPLTPFMVKWHLGNLLFIVIYTNLGLFAELSIFLWFWLKAHVFTLFWFKIDLDTFLYY